MLQEKFRGFLAREGLKQAYVARSLGVSSSQISQWLSCKYKGDVTALEANIKSFMENYSIKSSQMTEQDDICDLDNYTAAMFVAEEAIVNQEMVALYGIPGSGKSVVAKAFAKAHPESTFIEVVPGINVLTLLKLIAGKLGIGGVKSTDELIFAIATEFTRRDGVLVIDEAEHLTTKGLEVLRRIYDFSRVPVVLIGTYGLLKNLKGNNGELLQLYSRIQGRWEFKEPSESDMEKLFGEMAPAISKYTKHLRRAVNLYNKAKRYARIKNEALNAGHIEAASTMIFLD